MTVVRRAAGAAVAAAGTAAATGYIVAAVAGPGQTSRMLPWILGRGLGIAAYLALVALTGLGLWMRHPWRARWPHPSPDAQLRMHAVLAGLTLLLVLGHVIALVLDPWAGVGVRGAVVPGGASYRPVALALGTAAVYGGLLVGGTAALAGRIGRIWRPLHAGAAVLFAATFSHGVLAGSDTPRLRVLYVATGGLVAALALSRRLARPARVAVAPAAR